MSSAPFTSIADALQWAAAAGIERWDAQTLLAHTLGRSRAWLLAHDTDALAAGDVPRVHTAFARLASGEPLAYILGQKGFHGLDLTVNAAVLVPRADTEVLVNWALACLAEHPAGHAPRVLDLGTGSGAIALAIQAACPQAEVWAVDQSAAALAVAAHNAKNLGLGVNFRLGDWWQGLAGERFDLVVSNPPYIAEGDPHLVALRHEPQSALTAGPDGLRDLRAIIHQAGAHLSENAWMLLEHGYDQALAVQTLLAGAGFAAVTTRRDLGERDRCTGARWPG